MLVVCPDCQLKQNMRPDELLGRFFICRRCGRIERWEQPLVDAEKGPRQARGNKKARRKSREDPGTSPGK